MNRLGVGIVCERNAKAEEGKGDIYIRGKRGVRREPIMLYFHINDRRRRPHPSFY